MKYRIIWRCIWILNKMYFVYILECSDDTLYTGITTDLDRRILEHNGKITGGAKYTNARGPVELLHSEKYPTRSEALKREYEIKSLTRQQKLDLINSI